MSRNQPKRYLPFAASTSKRPLIPEQPVPKIRAIARSIRDFMGGGNASPLNLGPRAYFRIRADMQAREKRELADELAAKARATEQTLEFNGVPVTLADGDALAAADVAQRVALEAELMRAGISKGATFEVTP